MDISKMKNFAGTRIRTHDLPTQLFSIIAAPSYRLRPLMAGTVKPQLPACTLGDLAAAAMAAIATVSVNLARSR